MPVGAHRGDYVEGIGNRHDARSERDLLASQPARVTAPVPPLVVLGHGEHAVSQPARQRGSQLGAERRMRLDDRELVVGEAARLVQDRFVDAQLSDVVDESGPAQSVELDATEPELLAEHLRIGTHSLGVTPGDPVVLAQRSDQLEEVLGCCCGLVGPGLAIPAEEQRQVGGGGDPRRDGQP